MISIKSIVARKFGGLKNKKLTLGKNLNVIFGPNEAGKSSWVELYKVIMYGTPSKVKDEFEKFDVAAGIDATAEIEIDGKNYIFNKVNAKPCEVFDNLHQKNPDLSNKKPGEILFGVDVKTFEQTAFLSQMKHSVESTPDIERKIASIVQGVGSDGTVTFSEAKQKIDEHLKIIDGRRGGSYLPNLRKQLEEIEKAIEENEYLYAQAFEMTCELEKLKKQIDDAKASTKSSEIQRLNGVYYELQGIKAKIKQLSEQNEQLLKTISYEGFIADLLYISDVEQKCDVLINSEKQLREASSLVTLLESEYNTNLNRGSKYLFFSDDIQSVNSEKIKKLSLKLHTIEQTEKNNLPIFEQINEKKEKLSQVKAVHDKAIDNAALQQKKKKTKALFIGVSAIIALIVAAILKFVLNNDFLAISLAAVSVMAFIYLAFIVRKSQDAENNSFSVDISNLEKEISTLESVTNVTNIEEKNQVQIELKNLLNMAGCNSIKEFEDIYEDYLRYTINLKSKAENLETEKGKLKNAQQVYEMAKNDLILKLNKLNITFIDEPTTKAKLNILKSEVMTYRQYLNDIENLNVKFTTLLNGKTLEQIENLIKENSNFNNAPVSTMNYSENEVEQMERDLNILTSELGQVRGKISGSAESLSELEEVRDDIKAKIEHFTNQLEVLKVVYDQIEIANDEYQKRFSPTLNKETAEYFEKITGGKYKSVRISQEFEISVIPADEVMSFNQLAVSKGTLEQLLISLRLALVKNIYSGHHLPVIVLDDAFVNFDAERCHNALDLLIDISKDQQIIYMTCRNDVYSYLKNKSNNDINLIEYSQDWAI